MDSCMQTQIQTNPNKQTVQGHASTYKFSCVWVTYLQLKVNAHSADVMTLCLLHSAFAKGPTSLDNYALHISPYTLMYTERYIQSHTSVHHTVLGIWSVLWQLAITTVRFVDRTRPCESVDLLLLFSLSWWWSADVGGTLAFTGLKSLGYILSVDPQA